MTIEWVLMAVSICTHRCGPFFFRHIGPTMNSVTSIIHDFIWCYFGRTVESNMHVTLSRLEITVKPVHPEKIPAVNSCITWVTESSFHQEVVFKTLNNDQEGSTSAGSLPHRIQTLIHVRGTNTGKSSSGRYICGAITTLLKLNFAPGIVYHHA